MAGKTSTRVMLVTANIASCFEQPDTMLKPWITEFLKTVEANEPQFIALHCQEVGGKNYEESMQHVEHFVRTLLNRGTMLPYNKIRVFLDEEYESAEKFTALGNLYFIHQDVRDIQLWDFEAKKFTECHDRREYSGNIEDVPTKEKSKFPQEFFPECKWSRKGFMRTRWNLNGTKFDLVNIHLFHDASNFIAMEEFPSVYSMNRKRALEHTLDRFHNDQFENVPVFIFGDFNFRVNTHGVVQKLTSGCTPEDAEMPNTGEKAKKYKDNKGTVQLTISKKAFQHSEHDTIFLKDNGSLIKEFDQELSYFNERLAEFPISFPPSYPFEEGAGGIGSHYMKTRAPSWCDRVILDKAAKKLVDSSGGRVEYGLIGLETRMGDHKPVGLCMEVAVGAGIVSCCSPEAPCRNFVHEPDAHCFMQAGWCLCQSYPACPRPVVNSVYPKSSTLLPALPGQVSPLTSEAACANPVRADIVPDPVGVCVSGLCLVPQCVCSAGASEERISHHCHCGHSVPEPPVPVESGLMSQDLLRSLLMMGGKNAGRHSLDGPELMLKRVNSAPNTTVLPLRLQYHTPLVSSHSLDTGCCMHHPYPAPKLRLRASSSRLISHHSSSTEEWFEEVPDADLSGSKGDTELQFRLSRPASIETVEQVNPPAEPNLCANVDKPPGENMLSWSINMQRAGEDSGGSSGTESGGVESRDDNQSKVDEVDSRQVSTEQHSLNNLLLNDSCDRLSSKPLNQSESSLTCTQYSEDSVSSVGRPLKDGETVSQAPTFDIADFDPSDVSPSKHKKCQKSSHKPSADVSDPSSGQCCCVLS